MSLDEVETIMDDTRESVEYQRVFYIQFGNIFNKFNSDFQIKFYQKIDELISGQFAGESIDDEINAELESIIANSMPEVPSDHIPIPIAEKSNVNKKGLSFEKVNFSYN